VMNLTDLIIVYLACGAPFAVYFFLQNRENLNPVRLWLKTILVSLFWFLYGYVFLHRFVTKKLHNSQFAEKNQADSLKKLKIDEFEKTFAQYLLQNNGGISLFDFRETFERYVGLTLLLFQTDENVPTDSEFFRIAEHQNAKLGQICLQRRNRLRLLAHQTQAREDLLKIFSEMRRNAFDTKKLEFSMVEFFKIIEDDEANKFLVQIFRQPTQTEKTFPVRDLEIELWNSKEPKTLTARQTTLSLPIIQTTTVLPKPD
jgi:hypothetical protein